MVDEDPASDEEVRVYHGLLRVVALHSGHGVMERLGVENADVYRAIWERIARRATSSAGDGATLDQIDWAAVRAIVPVTRARITETEFRTLTGFGFDRLDQLLAKANSARKRWHPPRVTRDISAH